MITLSTQYCNAKPTPEIRITIGNKLAKYPVRMRVF